MNRQRAEALQPRSTAPMGRSILRRKYACGRHSGGGSTAAYGVPPIVREVLRSPGQPLDPAIRTFMEPRFREDFSRVRVHTGEKAAKSARAVDALAYTVGPHVAFAAGRYAPASAAGRRLLVHELAHVSQQRDVSGTVSTIEFDDTAEGEAEQVTRQALAGSTPPTPPAGLRLPSAVLHRQIGGSGSFAKSSNPKAIIPIGNLIRYVAAVEAGYPQDSAMDIVTRIRQSYYSGLLFEQLIPTAHTHDIRTEPGDFKPIQIKQPRMIDPGIGREAYEHLIARADENATGDNPSPYIKLEDGSQIDLGHLLLGLDALIHPSTSIPYSSYGVPGIDPASWVADLGIASVWMTQHEETGKPPSDAPKKLDSPDLDAYYQMSAPEQDLLGDVDSFSSHEEYVAAPAGQPLSQTLTAYYLGKGGGPPGIRKRWRTFCAKSGLAFQQLASGISWIASGVSQAVARVNWFSDLYAAGALGALGGALFGPKRRTWPYTGKVVTKFLGWVKPQLEKEVAS